jgi:hypothetical protein
MGTELVISVTHVLSLFVTYVLTAPCAPFLFNPQSAIANPQFEDVVRGHLGCSYITEGHKP